MHDLAPEHGTQVQPSKTIGSATAVPASSRRRVPPHALEGRHLPSRRFRGSELLQGAFYFVRQAGRTIVIERNLEHPFWRELIEHASESKAIATLDYLVFWLAHANLLVPKQANGHYNVIAALVGLLG